MFLFTADDQSVQNCIVACDHCHRVCLQSAMNHCLKAGGKHVEPDHFRMMMNCAEMCQTSVNFMLSSSRFSKQVCDVCAEICDACAENCAQLDGMEDCVQACRDCAESCRSMAA